MDSKYLEGLILAFRTKLNELYKAQPLTDEDKLACPATISLIIDEYDKMFDIKIKQKGEI